MRLSEVIYCIIVYTNFYIVTKLVVLLVTNQQILVTMVLLQHLNKCRSKKISALLRFH